MDTMRAKWRTGLAILLALAFWTGTARAETDTVDGVKWTYTVSDGTATVTGAYPAVGNLVIPATLGECPVTAIGDYAFSNCTGLTHVVIPESVTNIEIAAFLYCSGLATIEVAKGNAEYESDGGVLFGKGKKLLHTYPGGKKGSYEIPDGVTTIGAAAFTDCDGLKRVTIPESVTKIGMWAFLNCDRLTDVTIPGGVTNIGNTSFGYCTALQSVTIPDSVTSIENWAFEGCERLAGATLGDGIAAIGRGIFDATRLATLYVPEAWAGTDKLADARVPEGCDIVYYRKATVDGVEWRYVPTNGTAMVTGTEATGVVAIPTELDGMPVTQIGDWAFFGNAGLVAVTIPERVESVGENAFAYCRGLVRLYVPASREGTDMLAEAGVPSMLAVVYGEAPEGGEAAPGKVAFAPESGALPDAGEGLEVSLSAAPGMAVYYTLDGSRPVWTNAAGEVFWSAKARKYTELFEVSNGRDDGPDAISKIMTGENEKDDYDPWYEPAEAPRTIPVVRAAAVNAAGRVGDVSSASYLLGNMATRYGATPVFSLCAEWADLFDNVDGPGIYRNPTFWDKTKVPNAHVEFFDGGARRFAKWCELRANGTSTLKRPKKSLRLTGWKAYNPVKGKKEAFDYPFFADKTRTNHASIVLRMGGNDWNKAILRDRLAQELGADGQVDLEAGAVCVLFLNGVYWGVHEIRERYDAKWFEQRLGIGDSDAFSMLEYADGKPHPQAREGRGEDEDKEECRSQAATEFKGILDQLAAWGDDLQDEERYAWFTNRVNPDSLAAFFAAELFAGNSDWPWNNQLWWRVWPAAGEGDDAVDRSRPRNDGRWNWSFHDMDFAFALPFGYVTEWDNGLRAAHDSYSGVYPGEGPYVGEYVADASRAFRAAMKNPEFRERFLGRLYLRLATDWSAENTLAALDRIAATIREAGMDENGARWRQPQTAADWEKQLGDIRDYLRLRPEAFAWHTRRRYGLGAARTVALGTDGDGTGSLRVAGRGVEDGLLPLRGAFPCDLPLELEAVPAKGSAFAGWFAAPELLPAAPGAASAEDCAANYGGAGGRFPAASLGTGWDEWNVELAGEEGDAAAFTGTSQMPIHGRSENGNSFGLRACDGKYVNIRRELSGGAVLAVGEEMSLDVAFGLSGEGWAAGMAFVSAGGEKKPVELILGNEPGEGEGYRVVLGGTRYVVSNFRHVPGAPIHVALERTGESTGRLRLERFGETYCADIPLADGIAGIRLYKNPYGSAEAEYNLWFDNLRAGPAATAASTNVLGMDAKRETLFYEDGNAFNRWKAETDVSAGGGAGHWQNNEALSNIGVPCFGLWANGGGIAALRRYFGFALSTNCVLSVDFQNNALAEDGAAAGVIFLTADGESFRFFAVKGETNYQCVVGESGNPFNTGVPVRSTGIRLAVAATGENAVSLDAGGTVLTLPADGKITGIEIINASCGSGPPCNVFANRVWITKTVGAPAVEPADDPDNEGDGESTDENGTLAFYEEGRNLETHWTIAKTGGNAGCWTDGNGESAPGLYTNALGLWANTGDGIDAARNFAEAAGITVTNGTVLRFSFQNGLINDEEGSIGWELTTVTTNWRKIVETNSVGGVFVGREPIRCDDGSWYSDCYLWTNATGNATALGASRSATAQHVRIAFSSPTNAVVSFLGFTQEVSFAAAPTGIRVFNHSAGPDSPCNVFVNHFAVWTDVDARGAAVSSAKRAGGRRASREGEAGETPLSTERVWRIVPSDGIAVVARFVPAAAEGIDAWAAEHDIADPWTTNAASGRSFAEEYLLETNGVPTLHGIEDGAYRLHFAPGENGVGADIEVADALDGENPWRAPEPGELPPLDESGQRFAIDAPGTGPQLFIRLVLRPAAP